VSKITEGPDPAEPNAPFTEGARGTFVGDEPPGVQKIVSSLPVDHQGTAVYVKGWRYENGDAPSILIVHDLGEQTMHYRDAARAFVLAGYSVYLFDLRGHGRSGRRLGHAPSFNILIKDLLQVAAWVRHKEGGKPPVILGHGIGALITMDFTKHHGAFCKAAILSAPCLEPLALVSTPARFLLRVLAEVTPTFRIPATLTPRFTRDLKISHQQEGDEDEKLIYFPRLTAIFAHELLLAIKRAEARFIEYQGSVLILCPDQDSVCSYVQLKKSAALHNEHNLEIADLKGVGHGVFTDEHAAREQAMGVVLPWLKKAMRGPLATQREEVRLSGASRSEHGDSAEKPGASKL
jgi:alpha-beta hydrolase superfamily lysophospholipase